MIKKRLAKLTITAIVMTLSAISAAVAAELIKDAGKGKPADQAEKE